jgi:hypothetical protein
MRWNNSWFWAIILIVAYGGVPAAASEPPDAAEQEHILALMRQYARAYSMPDVLFDHTTTSFSDRRGRGKWLREATVTSLVMHHDGRLTWCCANKGGGVARAQPWQAALEFPEIFPWDGSKATVAWNRWDYWSGKRMAVFDYFVARPDSHYFVFNADQIVRSRNRQAALDHARKVFVPYSGSLWIDPEDGSIWRWFDHAHEIPPEFKSREISGEFDYDRITIGSSTYMLLVRKVYEIRWVTSRTRTEITWSNYRKFDADSKITFGIPDK